MALPVGRGVGSIRSSKTAQKNDPHQSCKRVGEDHLVQCLENSVGEPSRSNGKVACDRDWPSQGVTIGALITSNIIPCIGIE